MTAPAIDQDEEEQAHALHAHRRPTCEHAKGKVCKCSCGGKYHRHGLPYVGPPARTAGATARPRPHRKQRAQMRLLLT